MEGDVARGLPGGSGPAIDKGPGIGRILEHFQERRHGGLFPERIAEAIVAGQAQVLFIDWTLSLLG